MKGRYTQEDALGLLREKQAELSRLPQRSDFTAEEVCAIKAFLGPWPRALEKAGLKQPAPQKDPEQALRRRIEQKRACTQKKTEDKREEPFGIKKEEL